MNKVEEKKTINVGVATRGLIIGFLSYGILLTFIFFSAIIFLSWKINQSLNNEETIKYTVAVCAAFLMFFLIRSVCKLCTFDLFRNYKIKSIDVNKVCTRMNLFFIVCVILSALISLGIFNLNLRNHKITLLQNKYVYDSEYSEDFAEYLTLSLISEYHVNRAVLLIQMLIIESGVVFGLFSLTTIQKNYIEQYNDTSKEDIEEY